MNPEELRAVVRLDWNESPLGPSPVAVERVREHAQDLHRYPRGLAESVAEAVARDYGLPPERLLLTNGVDEATDLLMSDAKDAWSVWPGFIGYVDRAEALGVTAHAITLDEAWEPAIPASELAGAGPIFLDQPHNPTGRYFDPEWVTEVVRHSPMVCFDASYSHFADPSPLAPGDAPWMTAYPPGVDRDVLAQAMDESRLAVFHSFSKSHGLAGLRAGALIGSPELIARAASLQRAFTIDTVSLHALAGTLDDPGHRRALRAHILDARPRYAAVLEACPLLSDVRSTQSNFVLARGGDVQATTALVERLHRRGTWVKDLTSLGLPGWLRVTVGTDEALEQLSSALQAEVSALETAGEAR